MEKKKLDNAAEVKKDEALKESFAEIRRAAKADRQEDTPKTAEAPRKVAVKSAVKKEIRGFRRNDFYPFRDLRPHRFDTERSA